MPRGLAPLAQPLFYGPLGFALCILVQCVGRYGEQRLRQVLPEGHYAFGAVISQRSLLAQLRGDLAGALRLADEGLAVIEASMAAGEGGANTFPILLMQRSSLRLAFDQSEPAVADATLALRSLEDSSPADTHSIGLGRAYFTLSRALQGRGDPEGERAMLVSALAHFEDAAGPDHPETREARALLAAADAKY